MKKIIFIFNIILILLFLSCTPPDKYRLRNSHCKKCISNNEVGYSSKNVKYNRKKLIQTAEKYLGVKYKMGGTSPGGFDCSGLVMYVYKKNGLKLPRSADDQYYKGKKLNKKRLLPGDLVFFNTSGRGISHVGIYAGENRFIHAPRTGKKVSFADLNNSYWKKKYIGAVSYL